MAQALQNKLRGLTRWRDVSAPPSPCAKAALADVLREWDRQTVLHLGSHAHECWSVQREVRAVTSREMSVDEACQVGLRHRRVLCWYPAYWNQIPKEQKIGSRVICLFHHDADETFDDPQLVAGLCMNTWMREALQRRQPRKDVWVVPIGGAEDAVPYARRTHPTRKVRLLMCGNATARLAKAWTPPSPATPKRKGVELILPLADRLDNRRYAWVFVGVGWEPYAKALGERGWTVLSPGPLEEPGHFAYFGEGDIYLMLARLEGGPLTLLETMGLGLWPVCTPTGFAPDLVRHGETGHLVRPFDGTNTDAIADEVAEHLRTLDRTTLEKAKGRIRESVAHRTWRNFKNYVEAVIHKTFGVAPV